MLPFTVRFHVYTMYTRLRFLTTVSPFNFQISRSLENNKKLTNKSKFTYFPVSQVLFLLDGTLHVPPHFAFCDITRKDVCAPFEPHPLHELHAPEL